MLLLRVMSGLAHWRALSGKVERAGAVLHAKD